jgi:hypothetical protein
MTEEMVIGAGETNGTASAIMTRGHHGPAETTSVIVRDAGAHPRPRSLRPKGMHPLVQVGYTLHAASDRQLYKLDTGPSKRLNLDPDAPDNPEEEGEEMEDDDEAGMMAMMGLSGFGTTKVCPLF